MFLIKLIHFKQLLLFFSTLLILIQNQGNCVPYELKSLDVERICKNFTRLSNVVQECFFDLYGRYSSLSNQIILFENCLFMKLSVEYYETPMTLALERCAVPGCLHSICFTRNNKYIRLSKKSFPIFY